MFAGGIVTVFVSDLERSVEYYTERLGLRLLHHWHRQFAMIDAGHGLTIGLHPTTQPIVPGGPTAVSIGLQLSGAIDRAVEELRRRGVAFTSEILDDGMAGRFAWLNDPDGNRLYIRESQNVRQLAPEAVK